MVDTCANPRCAKPLKYLRDGRIYIFDVGSLHGEPGGKRVHQLEHFWLCGACCQNLVLVQDRSGIHVAPMPARVPEQFDSFESSLGPRSVRPALARGA